MRRRLQPIAGHGSRFAAGFDADQGARFLQQEEVSTRYLLNALACSFSSPAVAQDRDISDSLFITYCAACHGMKGSGGDPWISVLTATPPDQSRLSTLNDNVFLAESLGYKIDCCDPICLHNWAMTVFDTFFAGSETIIRKVRGELMLTSQPIVDLVLYLQQTQETDG
jgi:cytochrome c553